MIKQEWDTWRYRILCYVNLKSDLPNMALLSFYVIICLSLGKKYASTYYNNKMVFNNVMLSKIKIVKKMKKKEMENMFFPCCVILMSQITVSITDGVLLFAKMITWFFPHEEEMLQYRISKVATHTKKKKYTEEYLLPGVCLSWLRIE